MGENAVVTDMAQGVDCWMCEENEPHVHGPIQRAGKESLRWYKVIVKAKNWMIWTGYLVQARTAKEAAAKAQLAVDREGEWGRVVGYRTRIAEEKYRRFVTEEFPRAVIE